MLLLPLGQPAVVTDVPPLSTKSLAVAMTRLEVPGLGSGGDGDGDGGGDGAGGAGGDGDGDGGGAGWKLIR